MPWTWPTWVCFWMGMVLTTSSVGVCVQQKSSQALGGQAEEVNLFFMSWASPSLVTSSVVLSAQKPEILNLPALSVLLRKKQFRYKSGEGDVWGSLILYLMYLKSIGTYSNYKTFETHRRQYSKRITNYATWGKSSFTYPLVATPVLQGFYFSSPRKSSGGCWVS